MSTNVSSPCSVAGFVPFHNSSAHPKQTNTPKASKAGRGQGATSRSFATCCSSVMGPPAFETDRDENGKKKKYTLPDMPTTDQLQQLDHAHLWHPFTPMKQWRESPPLVIERGDGPYVFDTDGKRYIDGTSSLWCNVHGHRHPAVDAAVRQQLDKIIGG